MGVSLAPLITKRQLSIDELSGKVLAVDSFNILFQFLSSIRQRDGTPLKDSQGNITSHLSGLFFRTINLLSKGIKLVFVFDGETLDLKRAESERRKKIKEQAIRDYEIAKKREDLVAMQKLAPRTSILTDQMIEESKALVKALGMPVVQAPYDGEAQAAFLVKKGLCYAVLSQDYDSLLFGSSKLVRNLTISQRRKKQNILAYQKIMPEEIDLCENLNNLGIDHDQLIVLAMLIGTDYNIGGIKGIGAKKALQLVKEYKHDFEQLFKRVGWQKHFDFDWKEVFYIFKNIKCNDVKGFEFKEPDEDKIIEILVKNHDFSEERVMKYLNKLRNKNNKGKLKVERSQSTLNQFI